MTCSRRSFLGAVGLALASAATAGCSRDPGTFVSYAPRAEARQSVTLTVLGSSGPYFDHSVVSAAADSFMDENPEVLLSYDNVEGELYATAFERRLSTGHLDDVFMLDPSQARMVAAAGQTCDLSGLPGTEAFDGFVAEAARDREGRLVAAPTRVAPFALFCGTGACREAGVSAPGTLDGLEGLCRGWGGDGPLLEGDALALGRALVQGPRVLSLGSGAAAALSGSSGDPAALAGLFLDDLARLEALVATGALRLSPDRPGGSGWDGSSAFAAGEAPLMVSGSWAAGRLLRDHAGLDWSVEPLPGPDGRPFVVCDLDACVAVNGTTEHGDQARAFVEYLLRPEAMSGYCNDESCYRPVASAAVDGEHRLLYARLVSEGRAVAGNGLQYPDDFDCALSAAVEAVFSGAPCASARDTMARALAGSS